MPNGPHTGRGRRTDAWRKSGPDAPDVAYAHTMHLGTVPQESLDNLLDPALGGKLAAAKRHTAAQQANQATVSGQPGTDVRKQITPRMRAILEHYSLPELERMFNGELGRLTAASALAISQILAAADVRNGDRARNDTLDRLEGPVERRLSIDVPEAWSRRGAEVEAEVWQLAEAEGLVIDAVTEPAPEPGP